MKLNFLVPILLVLSAFVFASCSSPVPTIEVVTDNTTYPIPIYVFPTAVYPEPGSQANAPTAVTPFRLDKPVKAGALVVTGTGLAGVPVVLVNLNLPGAPLSSTTIAPDGKFQFDLAQPLLSGERIGITLRDQSQAGSFSDPGYQGDEPQDLPEAGFFYDTTQVVDE